MRPLARLFQLAAVAFSYFAVARAALAQDEAPGPRPIVVDGRGTEIFRYWIHKAGFQPLTDFEQARQRPASTLIVYFGNPFELQRRTDRAELQDFLGRGGAILVATDQRFFDPRMGIEITGHFVKVTQAKDGYRDDARCPIVRPIIKVDELDQESPRRIFLDLLPPADPVATNKPSTVRQLANGQMVRHDLAGYPASAEYENRPLFRNEQDMFAIAGTYGAGRMLVIADHSVFINRMMGQQERDNSNNEFAINCLAWLRESNAGGPRTRCLFVDDNAVQPRFDLPTQEIPEPPFDVLANMFLHHGNDLVNELQEKDFFNEFVIDQFGHRNIVRTILVCLTVLLIIYGFYRLWNARTGTDPGLVLAGMAAPYIPRGSTVKQRHRAQILAGNLYELARERARSQFEFIEGAENSRAGQPPRVLVGKRVPNAGRLRAEVERYWKIAFGDKPVRIARHEWTRFNIDLDHIVRAEQDGWWRFEKPSDRN